MVDLRERLAKKKLQKATSPIDIYNSLDRMASKGELRKAQKEILENWYKYRKDDKDLIIKLSTGRGKTLIGLLILQAKINNGEGPCLLLKLHKLNYKDFHNYFKKPFDTLVQKEAKEEI